MHFTTISSLLLVASSLVTAHPSQPHKVDVQQRQSARIPIHHVPEQYLSLFDPAKHEHVAAELKSHQERIILEEEAHRAKQLVLQGSSAPTSERLALKKNLASMRAQCRHADEALRQRLSGSNGGSPGSIVQRATMKSEAAGASLFAASVFAVGGAIGVAVLLL